MKSGKFLPIYTVPAVIILFLGVFIISGCASGSPASGSGSGVLRITLKVNDAGEIDTSGRGYYAILFNNLGESIEVTNYETFSDYVRFDGSNFSWFHRQGNVPSPGYTWAESGNVNADASISSGGKSIVLRFDLSDETHPFNSFIEANKFSIHVLTTDNANSLLGRSLDTLGQGPTIDGNALYTLFFDRRTGLELPAPTGYPYDPLNDCNEKADLGADYPYNNFDIESFTAELE